MKNQKIIEKYEKQNQELEKLKITNPQEYNKKCNYYWELQKNCNKHKLIQYKTTILTAEDSNEEVGIVIWKICGKCFGLFSEEKIEDKIETSSQKLLESIKGSRVKRQKEKENLDKKIENRSLTIEDYPKLTNKQFLIEIELVFKEINSGQKTMNFDFILLMIGELNKRFDKAEAKIQELWDELED